MTTLQEIHKNVLWHGHEFEACLNRAINICKDADDWEKLLVFVNKTENILREAKREIQKRFPPSRLPSMQVSAYALSASKPASSGGSVASYNSLPGQGLFGSSAKPMEPSIKDWSRSPNVYSYEKNDTSNNGNNAIAKQKSGSPTKTNSKMKYKWFDDVGRPSDNLLDAEKQKFELDLQRILIPNLPPFTTDSTLRSVFGRYGKVVDVRTSAPSNGKDGEGIVRFESRDVVTQLLHKTLVLNGTEVKVKPFYNRPEKENKPRSDSRDNKTMEMLTETTKTRKISSGEKQALTSSTTQGSYRVDATDKCIICKTTKPNCILLWCGHNVVCSTCGGRLKNCPKLGCGQSIEKLSLM